MVRGFHCILIDNALLVPEAFLEVFEVFHENSMNRIVLSLCLTLLANNVAMAQGPAAAPSTKVARYVFVLNSGGPAQSPPSMVPPALSVPQA